jgi:hypothetical protein
MRFRWLVCLLLASVAFAQAASPAPRGSTTATAEHTATAAPDQVPESKVSPNDAVLTVKGVCADASRQGDNCKTVVSKEQFEKVADALQPNMSPAIRLTDNAELNDAYFGPAPKVPVPPARGGKPAQQGEVDPD